MPIAERDLAVVAAAGDAGRPAILLPATEPIWERVIGCNVVHGRGRLVVPRAPGLATIHAYDGALITGDQKNFWISWVDPDLLVVVATRRSADSRPALAPVHRFPGDDASAVNNVRILRVSSQHR